MKRASHNATEALHIQTVRSQIIYLSNLIQVKRRFYVELNAAISFGA